jgi:hypothetical protein
VLQRNFYLPFAKSASIFHIWLGEGRPDPWYDGDGNEALSQYPDYVYA